MDRLELLEEESINVIRKAYENIPRENLGMLWSCGKDSTVMLHLVKKAFDGEVPFKLLHIDTGYKISKMIKYRDTLISKYGYDNLIVMNRDYLKYGECGVECCTELKTKPLNDLIYNEGIYTRYRVQSPNRKYVMTRQEHPIKGLFVGIRGDEESTRSKESFFSRRYRDKWDIEEPQLELWGHYNYEYDENSHLRIHPLLRWTEKDVWEYIKRENIEYINLYHSKDGERYRTIGCDQCTSKIKSEARNVDEIIEELGSSLANVKERATRKQDDKDNGSLEQLRFNGYM